MKFYFVFITLLSFYSKSFPIGPAKFTIGFKNEKDTIQRKSDADLTHTIEITATENKIDSLKDYLVSVEIDFKKTTIAAKDFEVVKSFSDVSVNQLTKDHNYIIIVIKKDNPLDLETKSRKIFFKVKIKHEKDDAESLNESEITEYELNILPVNETLKNYSILAYVGTNFDLVNGIQAKNLFFATNVFIPERKKWGINLGLYGNRTLTRTDSTRSVTFTSRIVSYGDTAIAYYRDSALQVTTRVSDNLGAYFHPLVPLKFLTDTKLRVYYAPQFEFIWRRTTIADQYLNNVTTRIDTIKRARPLGGATLVTPLSFQTNLNIYDVYMGIVGLLLNYETEDISVRISASSGYAYSYVPIGGLSSPNLTYSRTERKFFFGRLWIIEPTTGITIGAEVSNYFGKNKALPYYNVTLSKAFYLKSLSTVIKGLN